MLAGNSQSVSESSIPMNEGASIECRDARSILLLLHSPEENVCNDACQILLKAIESQNESASKLLKEGLVQCLESFILNTEQPKLQQSAKSCLCTTLRIALKDLYVPDETVLSVILQLLLKLPEDDELVEPLLSYFQCFALQEQPPVVTKLPYTHQLFSKFISHPSTQVIQSIFKLMETCFQNEILQKDFDLRKLISKLVQVLKSNSDILHEHVASFIAKIAEDESSLKLIAESEVVEHLQKLIWSNSPHIQIAGLKALHILSRDEKIRRHLSRESTLLDRLLFFLVNGNRDEKVFSLGTLANCCLNGYARREIRVKPTALKLVLDQLEQGDLQLQFNALSCICNLTCDSLATLDIVRLGGIQKMTAILADSKHPEHQQLAGQILVDCLHNHNASWEFVSQKGIFELLIKLLDTAPPKVQKYICWIVSSLVKDSKNVNPFMELGILGILLSLAERNIHGFFHSAVDALERILNHHLPAKYWLRKYLTVENVIDDGFYDIEWIDSLDIKMSKKFPSLDELKRMPVNDKREILLIDKNQDPTFAEYLNAAQQLLFGSTDISPTHTHAEIPMDPNGNVDQHGSFHIASDEEFSRGRRYSTGSIEPSFDSFPFQIEQLAILVANLMGGPISSENMASFSYKGDIEKIKFELNSNVIPIGRIKKGFFYHRALLFKALADRFHIPCSLYRGLSDRAWNGVIVTLDEKIEEGFIVDLIHEPGRLLLLNSTDAHLYQRL